MTAGDGSAKKRFLAYAGVFLLALALRFLYLHELVDNPTFEIPIIDSANYYRIASWLVEGGVMLDLFFYQSVFYPFFLSIVCSLSRSPLLWARVIQAVLGALTCLLTLRLGEVIFDRRTGVLAALITACYGPLIFFGGELLAAVWAAFWSVALILLFLKTGAKKDLRLCFVLGMGGAISVITRPTFLPFFLAGCLWLAFAFYRRPLDRRYFLRFILILTGFIVITLPISILSYRVTDHFGFIPASGGINLYIGNNPDFCRTVNARPGRDWDDLRNRPVEYGFSGIWGEDEYYSGEVLDYLRDRPGSFLRGLALKTLRFVNSREIARSVDIYTARRWSRLLAVLTWKAGRFGFPFGVLLPLSLLALIYGGRKVPAPLLLYLFLYPAAVILVFVSGRYRLPIIPPLSVLAAAGCFTVLRMIRSHNRGRLAAALGIITGVVLLTSLPRPFCEEKINYGAELHYCLASEISKTGEEPTERAIYHLEEAVRIRPDYADAHHNLGKHLMNLGRLEGAVNHFSEVLRLGPDSPAAHNILGAALTEAGKVDEAIDHFSRAIELQPDYGNAHNNLGVALMKKGEVDRAIVHYEEALRCKPASAEVLSSLVHAYYRQGDREKALEYFEKLNRIKPDLLSEIDFLQSR